MPAVIATNLLVIAVLAMHAAPARAPLKRH
jgi:hypothetical protein